MANLNYVKTRKLTQDLGLTRHSIKFIEQLLNANVSGTDSRIYKSRDCTLRVSGVRATGSASVRYRSATLKDVRESLEMDRKSFTRKFNKAVSGDILRIIVDQKGEECIMINPYLYYDGVDANIPYVTWLWCLRNTKEAVDVLKESCVTGVVTDPRSKKELHLTTEDHLRYADFHDQLQSSEDATFIFIRAQLAKNKLQNTLQ